MKNLLISGLLTLIFPALNGQVLETSRQMSQGVQSGYTVSVAGAGDKMMEKVWKQFTRSQGKTEIVKKSDELLTRGAVIGTAWPEPLDIYFLAKDKQAIAFFDTRSGFVNAKDFAGASKAVTAFMEHYGQEVQREMIREEIDEEDSRLKKAVSKLEKLKKEHAGYHKNIEDARARIKKAEENIESNEKDQVRAEADIRSQSQAVEVLRKKLEAVGKSK